VLYITYDGLLEPLGQSQVLPYLRELAGEFAFTILSFEKPQDLHDSQRRRQLQKQLETAGIKWIPLRYHKWPSVPATAFDIMHGVVRGIGVAMRQVPKIVHVRGYVPGVIGLVLKRAAGMRLIFDMRGFWPDEKWMAARGSRVRVCTGRQSGLKEVAHARGRGGFVDTGRRGSDAGVFLTCGRETPGLK